MRWDNRNRLIFGMRGKKIFITSVSDILTSDFFQKRFFLFFTRYKFEVDITNAIDSFD